jgi:ClpP class serine protease
VKEARGLDDAGFAPVADGRVVSGKRALELKLIDELGGLAEAGRSALELAGIKGGRPRFVTPREDVPPWVQAVFRSAADHFGVVTDRAVRSVTSGLGTRIEFRAPLDAVR